MKQQVCRHGDAAQVNKGGIKKRRRRKQHLFPPQWAMIQLHSERKCKQTHSSKHLWAFVSGWWEEGRLSIDFISLPKDVNQSKESIKEFFYSSFVFSLSIRWRSVIGIKMLAQRSSPLLVHRVTTSILLQAPWDNPLPPRSVIRAQYLIKVCFPIADSDSSLINPVLRAAAVC